jgi:uncharacterized membrane protein
MNSPAVRRPWSQSLTAIRLSAVTRTRVAWLVIVAGAVLRVAQYLSGRSLWLDEAMLALNIIRRPWAGLLLPLDYHQGAPVGYLMLVKAVTTVFGTGEMALRLVPVLAGLLALPLVYWLAQELLEPNAVLLAVGLFAVLDPLIDYSSEAKQYSSDVLVALLLLLAAARYLRLSHPSLLQGLALGLLGAMAIWFSHPAVFVLGGVGLTLLWAVAAQRRWSALAPLMIAGGLWLACLGAEYMISLRYLSRDQALLLYWQSGFMPIPPLNVSWYLNSFFNLFQYAVGLTLAGVGLGALTFLAGVVALRQRPGGGLALLLSPLGVTLLASGAHQYPFSGRLLLFAVPAVILIVAAGAAYLFETLQPAPVAAWLLVGLLFLNPLYDASYHLIHPRTKEEARPVLSYLRQHWQAGDVIYLPYPSLFAYDYYAPRLGLDSRPVVVGPDSDHWNSLFDDVDRQRGQPRVWFVFLHIQQPDQTVLVYLSYLDRIGARLDAYHASSSAVYLYNLAPGAP